MTGEKLPDSQGGIGKPMRRPTFYCLALLLLSCARPLSPQEELEHDAWVEAIPEVTDERSLELIDGAPEMTLSDEEG